MARIPLSQIPQVPGPSGAHQLQLRAPQLRGGGVPAGAPSALGLSLEQPGGVPIDAGRASMAFEGEARGALQAGKAWAHSFDQVGSQLQAIAAHDRQVRDRTRSFELDVHLKQVFDDYLKQLPADPEQWVINWKTDRDQVLERVFKDNDWSKRDRRKADPLVKLWKLQTEYSLGQMQAERQRSMNYARFQYALDSDLEDGRYSDAAQKLDSFAETGALQTGEFEEQRERIQRRKTLEERRTNAMENPVAAQAEVAELTQEYEAASQSGSLSESQRLAKAAEIEQFLRLIDVGKAQKALQEVEALSEHIRRPDRDVAEIIRLVKESPHLGEEHAQPFVDYIARTGDLEAAEALLSRRIASLEGADLRDEESPLYYQMQTALVLGQLQGDVSHLEDLLDATREPGSSSLGQLGGPRVDRLYERGSKGIRSMAEQLSPDSWWLPRGVDPSFAAMAKNEVMELSIQDLHDFLMDNPHATIADYDRFMDSPGPDGQGKPGSVGGLRQRFSSWGNLMGYWEYRKGIHRKQNESSTTFDPQTFGDGFDAPSPAEFERRATRRAEREEAASGLKDWLQGEGPVKMKAAKQMPMDMTVMEQRLMEQELRDYDPMDAWDKKRLQTYVEEVEAIPSWKDSPDIREMRKRADKANQLLEERHGS